MVFAGLHCRIPLTHLVAPTAVTAGSPMVAGAVFPDVVDGGAEEGVRGQVAHAYNATTLARSSCFS